ncbi:MAG: prepilin-type N-terminal cleavage/methylation domain-containing protein [Verrucomicrobia bacterium]|nr:prepilin-type N-terminal cleavage/methylation domain-containing protein [Verrucomicrobiota bacterium]
MKQKKQGFTLVEIMIVVAIIGLLAAIGIPSILNAYTKSQEKAKQRNIADVEKAKGMLQLPSTVYSLGVSATNGQVVSAADIIACMNGVDDITDLTVGGDAITVGAIGTVASY